MPGTLQEDGPATWVGRDQPHGAVSTQALQDQMLVLSVAVGPGDLQNSRGAVAKPDRSTGAVLPCIGTVEGEIPLGQCSTS